MSFGQPNHLNLWYSIYHALSDANLYYTGQKIYKKSKRQAFEDLDGQSIMQYLTSFIGDHADIIHPDLNSVFNPFDNNADKAEEGLMDFGMQLFDIKCNLLRKTVNETRKVNPSFTKPIIAVINNAGIDLPKENKYIDANKNYGSHWICFVLLPKNFRGLLKTLDNTLNAEQIFLYDSLSGSSFVRLSIEFQSLFTQGKELIRNTDKGSQKYNIPPLVSSAMRLYKHSVRQQYENSCGYWAILNGIMTVLTGSDTFFKSYIQPKFFITDSQRSHAEYYLRDAIVKLNRDIQDAKDRISPEID